MYSQITLVKGESEFSMIKLTTGKKTNKELAAWFDITPNSFSRNKEIKLEELKKFAKYHMAGTKVVIDEVLNPYYSKQGSKAFEMIKSKIDETWSKDGLDSCSRVGLALEKQIPLNLTSKTVYQYTIESRNELYGHPNKERGSIGSCISLLCKKEGEGDKAKYYKFTPQEERIKDELIKKYYGNTTEKQALVKSMIDTGEITKEEGWDVLESLTNNVFTNEAFMSFLQELQELLGCKIVRGTLVIRDRDQLPEVTFTS